MARERPYGTATDEMIYFHQNRVKQEAERYNIRPLRISGQLSEFGGGISSLGERYHHGKPGYCPAPGHCRADATVAGIEYDKGLVLKGGKWVKLRQKKSELPAEKS